MKYPIKLIIKAPKPTKGDWMFYREIDRVLLDNYSPIQTEAQFAYYIYKKFGPGRYQVLAFQKGHEGFWMFWLGNIYENGFIRDLNKNKELNRLKKEFSKSTNFEEKKDIEEFMDLERNIHKEESGNKRRGPYGLIKFRSGMLHPYQEF